MRDRPVKQIYTSGTAGRRPRPAADRANDGHCDHAAETGSSERTAASASTSARLDRACTSVPGAHAVDGPGAAAYRNNTNNSGDGDDAAGSVSSAVREVQTYLERSQSGSAGASTGASTIATAHPRRRSSSASNNNAGSSFRDLTNHPEIEYLAEATLVEEASEEGDDAPPDAPDGSRGSAASPPARGGRPNSGGEQAGGGEDDISTLGPPPEVAQQQQRLERRESGNTNPTATDTVHGSMVITAKKMDNVCGFISRRSFFTSISVFVLLLLVVGLAVGLTKGTEWGNSETLFSDPDEVLTTVPEPICLSYLPQVSNISKACPDPTSLPRGGPLCQLLAEAFLQEADRAAEEIHQFPHHHIDIAIINAGAIRRDILPGDLTVGTVRTQVFPFPEDRAAYLSVTPAEIKATLETPLIDDGLIFTEQMQKEFFPDVPTVKLQRSFEAKYPYAAGLRYDVNISAPDGEKVSNILIHPPYAGDDDWIALDVTDESTLLRVVTSDYLAGGGDGYFPGVPRERVEILENLALADLFLSYCSRQEELIGPDRIEDMSTRDFVYDTHAATTDD